MRSIAHVRPAKGTSKKGRLSECVRNYKRIYDVTSPGLKDRELLQNSWEEIGREVAVSPKAGKELGPLHCPLVDVLPT